MDATSLAAAPPPSCADLPARASAPDKVPSPTIATLRPSSCSF